MNNNNNNVDIDCGRAAKLTAHEYIILISNSSNIVGSCKKGI